MRTAGDPDIYPNLGKFNISYSLFPHVGDWKNGVWAEGKILMFLFMLASRHPLLL